MSFLVKDREFYKRFFSLTVLLALQNVIVLSVNLADNVMIGAYSETALSGVALVNQVQFFLQMVISAASLGIVMVSSRYWGRKDVASIRQTTTISFWIGAIIGALLLTVMAFIPREFLSLLTPEEPVIDEGVRYLQIICYSYLFFCMTNMLLGSLRSVETVHIAFIVSLSTLAINVFLNWILIFGNLGAPEMGVQGAAIATLTARIIEFLIVAVYMRYIDKKIRFRFRDLLRINRPLIKHYFKISWTIVAADALWGIAMTIQAGILGHLGSSAVAASSVATTVAQILSVAVFGASGATSVIISKTIGAGQIDLVKPYTKTLQLLYVMLGILSGIVILLLKDLALSLYDLSAESMALSNDFIVVLAFATMGTAYQVSSFAIVRSGGQPNFVLYNDLIFMWGIILPVSLLMAFVFHCTPLAVFVCLKADQVLKCGVAFVKVNRFKWVHSLDMKQSE